MKRSSIIHRPRDAGLKPTIARINILQAIEASAPAYICTENMFRQMILRGTRASIGTVYRAIHQLEAEGLLLREWDHSRTAYYRVKPSACERPTRHILCRTCSRSVAFTDAGFLGRLEGMAQSQGILIVAQEVTIQVDCAGYSGSSDDCRAPARWPSPSEVIANQSESREARL